MEVIERLWVRAEWNRLWREGSNKTINRTNFPLYKTLSSSDNIAQKNIEIEGKEGRTEDTDRWAKNENKAAEEKNFN